jgi:large subunit ribosomal protein L15
MKVKKRKKSSRMHGRKMGTHGRGARKKAKGKGHRGGKGMSGSGKRADHKKTLITKKYANNYFGKQGITSKSTKRIKNNCINLRDLLSKKELYGKKEGDEWIFKIREYKILSAGEVNEKLKIFAKEASKAAIKKVKNAGGEIVIDKPKKEKVKEEGPRKKDKE